MSDVNKRPIKNDAKPNDFIVVQNSDAGLGDEKRIPLHLLTSGTFSNPIYNGDGTLASATISGVTYTFTYSAGKIATVTGGGVTKTYTWSGDQLQSVEVS